MGPCVSSNSGACYLSTHQVDNSNDFDDEPIAAFVNPKDHINDFDWENDIIMDMNEA